jgi:hypothetical protein
VQARDVLLGPATSPKKEGTTKERKKERKREKKERREKKNIFFCVPAQNVRKRPPFSLPDLAEVLRPS